MQQRTLFLQRYAFYSDCGAVPALVPDALPSIDLNRRSFLSGVSFSKVVPLVCGRTYNRRVNRRHGDQNQIPSTSRAVLCIQVLVGAGIVVAHSFWYLELMTAVTALFQKRCATLEYRPAPVEGSFVWYWSLLPLPDETHALATGSAANKGKASMQARQEARRKGYSIASVRIRHAQFAEAAARRIRKLMVLREADPDDVDARRYAHSTFDWLKALGERGFALETSRQDSPGFYFKNIGNYQLIVWPNHSHFGAAEPLDELTVQVYTSENGRWELTSSKYVERALLGVRLDQLIAEFSIKEAFDPDDINHKHFALGSSPKWKCPACQTVYTRRGTPHYCIGGFRKRWADYAKKGKHWILVYEALDPDDIDARQYVRAAFDWRSSLKQLGFDIATFFKRPYYRFIIGTHEINVPYDNYEEEIKIIVYELVGGFWLIEDQLKVPPVMVEQTVKDLIKKYSVKESVDPDDIDPRAYMKKVEMRPCPNCGKSNWEWFNVTLQGSSKPIRVYRCKNCNLHWRPDMNPEPKIGSMGGCWYPTEDIKPEEQAGTYQCPECRAMINAVPDDEGLIDCTDCGIWFDPAHPDNLIREGTDPDDIDARHELKRYTTFDKKGFIDFLKERVDLPLVYNIFWSHDRFGSALNEQEFQMEYKKYRRGPAGLTTVDPLTRNDIARVERAVKRYCVENHWYITFFSGDRTHEDSARWISFGVSRNRPEQRRHPVMNQPVEEALDPDQIDPRQYAKSIFATKAKINDLFWYMDGLGMRALGAQRRSNNWRIYGYVYATARGGRIKVDKVIQHFNFEGNPQVKWSPMEYDQRTAVNRKFEFAVPNYELEYDRTAHEAVKPPGSAVFV